MYNYSASPFPTEKLYSNTSVITSKFYFLTKYYFNYYFHATSICIVRSDLHYVWGILIT